MSLLLLVSSHALSQSSTESFVNVPIEANGVPFSQFVAIAQDSEGFLWLSTYENLLKYDGYEVEVHGYNPEDSTSLAGDRIGALFLDSRGTLWVGHNRGVSRYDPIGERFVNYLLAPAYRLAGLDPDASEDPADLPRPFGRAITEDLNQQVWVGTSGGFLFRYEYEKDTFLPFLHAPDHPVSIPRLYINTLMADKQNHLWIGGGRARQEEGGGLVRLDLHTGVWQRFGHETGKANTLVDSRVTTLLEDQDGRILVGTYKSGLHQYHPGSGDFTRLTYDPDRPGGLYAPVVEAPIYDEYPPVNILHQDRQGGFWIGTAGIGLYYFGASEDKLNGGQNDTGPLVDLAPHNFSTLFEDRQGQLWLGANPSGGLFKKDLFAPKFTWYPHVQKAQRSARSRTSADVFWISSMGEGLKQVHRDSGVIRTYLHDEDDPGSIGSNWVRAVYEDAEGILWAGLGDGGYGGMESGTGGLGRLDMRKGRFEQFAFPRKDKPGYNGTVYALHEDAEGRLWFDTGLGGLYRSDRKKEAFAPYIIPGTEGSEVWLLEDTHRQELWVTDNTRKVIYRYVSETDRFVPVVEGFASETILVDELGYWITTITQGLVHIDPGTGAIQRFTTQNGLPSNQVMDIRSTEPGIYWIATRKGITRFDARTRSFRNQGMPRGYFHPIWIKAEDGQLFFGADEGLVAFYPEEVAGNPIPPELAFQRLYISGEPYPLVREASGAYKKIQLSSRQNDLSISYVALHFSDPQKNSYQYRLIPYVEDWQEAGTRHNVQYTNLDPGDYRFEVRAANRDGVWTEEVLVLPFQIHAAWWTSVWFIIACLAIIAGIGYWLYRFQLSRTLAFQETKRLQEIDQLKTSLYNNLTHEFRTPLTVILGMTENLGSELAERRLQSLLPSLRMIERHGKNLLHLVNEMLALAKVESGKLELSLRQGDVVPLVRYLVESFHSMAEKKNIQLAFYPAQPSLVMDHDADKLAVIVSNLLSNAIKFTPEAGEVSVHLNPGRPAAGQELVLSVSDTGIGIAPEDIPHLFDRFYQVDPSAVRRYPGTGIGLALAKELVSLMGGSIEVDSSLGRGSIFTLRLPVHRNAPLAESMGNGSLAANAGLPVEPPLAGPLAQGEADLPWVLIIEDQVDVAHYIGTCLRGKYQYLHATHGKLGVETAFEKIPDLIICDVMMPEMDGYEVCATLKQDERTNHIPIVMLTARVSAQDRLAGLARGADAYLAKPFEKDELLVRLEHLIALRKTLQEKYSKQLTADASGSSSKDEEDPFLARARAILLAELEREDFSIDEFAERLHLSRSQVHRKIKALTGLSTALFIRSVRLREARQRLTSSADSVSEIAYQVGFKTPVYFSQVFKETYGKSPSDYRK